MKWILVGGGEGLGWHYGGWDEDIVRLWENKLIVGLGIWWGSVGLKRW